MPFSLTPQMLEAIIDRSNAAAAGNRNLYTIQEQATISAIYECVACVCPQECFCRKHGGCDGHYLLRENATSDELVRGFLRMFVDQRAHAGIQHDLAHNVNQFTGRPARCIGFIRAFLMDPAGGPAPPHRVVARQYNRTLVCDNWLEEQWQGIFAHVHGAVYASKIVALLLPDLAIPYDTRSWQLMSGFGVPINSYIDLLGAIRAGVRDFLDRHRLNLEEFRCLDAPGKSLQFDVTRVSLPPPPSGNLPARFLPAARPLSRVVDKRFYSPASGAASRITNYHASSYARPEPPASAKEITSPLARVAVTATPLRDLLLVSDGKPKPPVPWDFSSNPHHVRVLYQGMYSRPREGVITRSRKIADPVYVMTTYFGPRDSSESVPIYNAPGGTLQEKRAVFRGSVF